MSGRLSVRVRCDTCGKQGTLGNTIQYHRVYDRPGSRLKVMLCSKCVANIESRKVARKMSEFVEMTEFVRFNKDGSSSHIKVIDGEIFDSFDMNPSPYVIVKDWPPVPAGKSCDWIVEVTKWPPQ